MNIRFCIIVPLVALFLNSCAGTRDSWQTDERGSALYTTGWFDDDGLSTKYLTYAREEKLLLFPEKKRKSPRLDFFVDTLDILDESERKLLQQFLYDNLSCQNYVDNLFNKIKTDYLKMKDDAARDPSEQYNWSYTEAFDGRVYPSLFVISRSRYTFFGGAHGMNEKNYFVLDRDLLTKVELSDILASGAIPALQEMIDADLRARYHAAPDAPLTSVGFLEESAGVPDNFFISREGLGFCWNPYEVAPYVMGAIDVVLAYERVENLLNDRGRELFNGL